MKGTYDNAVLDPSVPAAGGGVDAAASPAKPRPGLFKVATFDRRDVDGCAVVGAVGEIDVSSAPAFRAALLDAVERSERLVVDLSSVTFLDCAGLSALASVVRRVRAAGEMVHLVGVTGTVGRVITLTRLDQVVAVDASVDDALASMTSRTT